MSSLERAVRPMSAPFEARRPGVAAPPTHPIRLVTHLREIELALEGGPVLIFKHSYRCEGSLEAFNEVVRFTDEHHGLPILMIDVVSMPDLARFVSRRLGIPHATPQVILALESEAWWYASHAAVRARAIEEAIRP